jgi:hypothetical protein
MKRAPNLRKLLLGLLSSLFLVRSLSASNLVYEGFNYEPSRLLSRSGGIGFSGPWEHGGFNAYYVTHEVTTGSLARSSLSTVGNKMTMQANPEIGGMRRRLASSIGYDGQTVYLSFLIRAEGVVNGGSYGGFFGVYLDSVKGEPDLFIGKGGEKDLDHWLLEDRGGSGQFPSKRKVVSGETVHLVLKAEFREGKDRFSLFVNPSSSETPVADAIKMDIDLGLVDALVIYSGGAFSLDEIRIGTSFQDLMAPL